MIHHGTNTGTLIKVRGIVGLTGLARSGKDLLCTKLSERGAVVRVALADALKQDMRDFLILKYGIDILHCSAQEKETIRPLLVAHGCAMRSISNGECWIKKVHQKVVENALWALVVVTDIRFPNELAWLKKLGGALVHVRRYDVVDCDRRYLSPPNAEEAEHDPRMRESADFKLEWPTCDKDGIKLNAEVDDVVSYLNGRLI